jgi:hypothetical protein
MPTGKDQKIMELEQKIKLLEKQKVFLEKRRQRTLIRKPSSSI